MAVKPIPDGYHTATPYLIISGAADAIEFYKKALGAKEMVRMDAPGGKIGHAEIQIGDSMIMLSDENPDMGAQSAQTLGGSPISIVLYVQNVDAAFETAVKQGATPVRPLENQFYGDRAGTVADPFGLQWHLHQHIEDVTPEQMEQRAAAAANA